MGNSLHTLNTLLIILTLLKEQLNDESLKEACGTVWNRAERAFKASRSFKTHSVFHPCDLKYQPSADFSCTSELARCGGSRILLKTIIRSLGEMEFDSSVAKFVWTISVKSNDLCLNYHDGVMQVILTDYIVRWRIYLCCVNCEKPSLNRIRMQLIKWIIKNFED